MTDKYWKHTVSRSLSHDTVTTPEQQKDASLTIAEYAAENGLEHEETRDILEMLGLAEPEDDQGVA